MITGTGLRGGPGWTGKMRARASAGQWSHSGAGQRLDWPHSAALPAARLYSSQPATTCPHPTTPRPAPLTLPHITPACRLATLATAWLGRWEQQAVQAGPPFSQPHQSLLYYTPPPPPVRLAASSRNPAIRRYYYAILSLK